MAHRIVLTIPCSLLLLGATAGSPQGAFANLYQIAVALTNDPSSYFENPDFPYPSEVQKGWQDSIATRGQELSPDVKKTLVDCAAKLNDAIDSMERGYRIKITQTSSAAQKTVDGLYARAKQEVTACASANDLAVSSLRQQQQGQQQGGTEQSTTNQPDLQGQTYNQDYGATLPAMQGQTTLPNGETFRLSTVAGHKVGQSFEGPVQGTLGTTAFSKARGVFQSKTQVEITAIWDKSGKPIAITAPITIGMKPK